MEVSVPSRHASAVFAFSDVASWAGELSSNCQTSQLHAYLQSANGSHEDATLLLAIKDAEISTLRQQMAQLADDLKRNLAVRH